MPPQALQDVRVLDFTQLLQGPYATQMLGDLGADVIKIEKPGTGDLYRSMTFFNQWIGDGESPCFLPWNRNKRSLAIDLKAPEARDIVLRLAGEADVVVENFRPGVMDKLGLGYETVRALNPRLIYASASGWGPDGPYAKRPGQDLLVQGLSGAVFASGKKSAGPVAIGTALSDQLGALHLVYAILAALYHRERSGEGQRIEVNLLQSVLAFEMQDFFTVHNLGRGFERPESGIAHPGNGAPFGIYPTADGWITIAMNPWPKIVAGIGDPALHAYNDPQTLFDRRDEIYGVLEGHFRTRTTEEWLERLLALDIWCAPALELKDVAADPQVRHLEAFTEVDHPKAGRVCVTNIPFRMSATPGSIRRPAPLVGQHGREILRELGYNDARIAELEARGLLTVEEVSA
ncbi:MAG: CoA transferase [Opitutales bacterium]|nr:CoA transferase [Opitutales bacterium]